VRACRAGRDPLREANCCCEAPAAPAQCEGVESIMTRLVCLSYLSNSLCARAMIRLCESVLGWIVPRACRGLCRPCDGPCAPRQTPHIALEHGKGSLQLLRCAAVSQRNIAEHFPHLAEERGALLEALLEFAEEHLERFPEPDVAADVYITAAGRARTPTDFCATYNFLLEIEAWHAHCRRRRKRICENCDDCN